MTHQTVVIKIIMYFNHTSKYFHYNLGPCESLLKITIDREAHYPLITCYNLTLRVGVENRH